MVSVFHPSRFVWHYLLCSSLFWEASPPLLMPNQSRQCASLKKNSHLLRPFLSWPSRSTLPDPLYLRVSEYHIIPYHWLLPDIYCTNICTYIKNMQAQASVVVTSNIYEQGLEWFARLKTAGSRMVCHVCSYKV